MDEKFEKQNRIWYKNTYDSLILKAKERGLDKSSLEGYYEKHHIIPRCLGGDNSKDNLVLLTYREHIIAHRLLYRINPDKECLLTAVIAMLSGPKGLSKDHDSWNPRNLMSSRDAEYYRKLYSDTKKGKPRKKHSEETKQKISKANKGRKFTPEQSAAHSIKMKNRIITDEWRKNISKGMTGKPHPHKNPNLSDEVRRKMADLCRSRVGDKHPNSKKVIDDSGNIYSSVTECAKANGITRECLSYKLNHGMDNKFRFLE